MWVRADGALQIGLPPAELIAAAQSTSLQWPPGQNGTVNVSLPLAAMGNVLQQGVLVVQLENVTNADLSAEQDTCLVSQLPQKNLTVVLAMQANQVPSMYLLPSCIDFPAHDGLRSPIAANLSSFLCLQILQPEYPSQLAASLVTFLSAGGL